MCNANTSNSLPGTGYGQLVNKYSGHVSCVTVQLTSDSFLDI